jgi:hypothetical protein
MGYFPVHGKKTLITKEKEEKMEKINTMKTNSKRRKDLRYSTWNVRSLYRPGGLRITINELRKYKITIVAIQETRWNNLTHKPLRAMLIPAALPIIMKLEQLS